MSFPSSRSVSATRMGRLTVCFLVATLGALSVRAEDEGDERTLGLFRHHNRYGYSPGSGVLGGLLGSLLGVPAYNPYFNPGFGYPGGYSPYFGAAPGGFFGPGLGVGPGYGPGLGAGYAPGFPGGYRQFPGGYDGQHNRNSWASKDLDINLD